MLPHTYASRCGSQILRRTKLLSILKPQSLSSTSQQRYSSSNADRPKTIFSGIQPTGVPHLGNYLGALQQWVKLQDETAPDTKLLFSLVDLHAITLPQKHAHLRQWREESFKMLLAIGLDYNRSTIFYQSDVWAHTQLMWILSCQASTGYLSRMTQWKEKTSQERENIERLKLGLFSYPVLQAADILVHGATHVPVGHDQAQHLEFTRELATNFNHTYSTDILVPPQTIISPAKRIMSLSEPSSKMSKSHANEKSRILLSDSDAIIKDKIRAAVTDSFGTITYDPEKRPGVSNLVDILYHCSPQNHYMDQQDVVDDVAGLNMQGFKAKVAESVEGTVRPIRERYEKLMDEDEEHWRDICDVGQRKAQDSADHIYETVMQVVGLR